MILNSHNGHQILVDIDDLPKLSAYKWYAYNWGGDRMYAFARINGRWTRMHRFIMNASNPEIFIDHKDRNGLNNQKSNLREATRSQNNANKKPTSFSSSRFLGVSKRPSFKWSARITKNGVTYDLGEYNNEEDAARAYDKKALELHGEFANLNLNPTNQKIKI